MFDFEAPLMPKVPGKHYHRLTLAVWMTIGAQRFEQHMRQEEHRQRNAALEELRRQMARTDPPEVSVDLLQQLTVRPKPREFQLVQPAAVGKSTVGDLQIFDLIHDIQRELRESMHVPIRYF